MRLTHCGKMIIRIVCRRVKASEAADSHCVVGYRLHGAAHDLRHVRHHRQRQAERRLDPVGDRYGDAEHGDLERQQEHAVKKQHQPWRVAEEMRGQPGALSHRWQQRNLRESKQHSRQGPGRHRDRTDREVEHEAAQQHGRPLPERGHDRWLPGLHLRLRPAATDQEQHQQRHAVRRPQAQPDRSRDALRARLFCQARYRRQQNRQVGRLRQRRAPGRPATCARPPADAPCRRTARAGATGRRCVGVHVPNPGTLMARSHRCIT